MAVAFTSFVDQYSGYAESGRRFIFGEMNGDTSYPTGGSVVTPQSFPVVSDPVTSKTLYPAPAQLDQLIIGISTDGTVIAMYDFVTSKVKCFSTNAAPVVEVANATNLSAKLFTFVAICR